MSPLRLGLTALVGAAALAASFAAHADVREALGWARQQGCARPASAGAARLTPVREDPRLDRIAVELARGVSLARALIRGTYRATRAAEIVLTGRLSDADVSSTLLGNDCATLTDPAWRDYGLARSGGRLWIVLAAPLAVPRAEDAAALDAEVLAAVNATRARGARCGGRYYPPAPPLAPEPRLAAAAVDYSREMARSGHFDHRGLDGSTPHTRVVRAGYVPAIVGENIAAGTLTPAEAMRGWLASAGHCRNIMEPRYRQTGIGFAVNTAQRLAVYWTEEFAAPAIAARR